MENNNPIHPDEMDRLLREAFLNGPDSETDKLSEMMANHVYNTNWGVVPPAGKAQHFLAKKLFFKGFSLNFIIGITVTVAIGITAVYVAIPVLQGKETSEVKQPEQTQHETAIVPTDSLPKEETQRAETIAAKEIRKPKQQEKKPKLAETTLAIAPKDTVPAPVKSTENSTKNKPTAPKRKRYILVPDITEAEAIANEKQKQEMVRLAIKRDAKEWTYIPMGSTNIDGNMVSLQAFFMQTHEVSNLQYRTFLYDLVIHDKLLEYEKAAVYDSGWVTISHLESFVNQYFWNPKFNDYPVVNITAQGATMYCNWLTDEVNKACKAQSKALINDIRLPAVSEWIYAARGGNEEALYAWGGPFFRNSKGSIMGNFQGREMDDYDGAEVTAPVTSYYPNPWGLYNMSGNVAEMTRPDSDGTLFIKGGAWNRKDEYMQIMHTNKTHIDNLPTTNVGFRPVYTYMVK